MLSGWGCFWVFGSLVWGFFIVVNFVGFLGVFLAVCFKKIIDFGVLLLKQFCDIANPSMPDFNKIYNRMNSLIFITSHA